jgi:hypothetical protein
MLLWQGLYTWLEGRPRRAHQTWHNALAAASDHAMPYEQALAHYEIGRHSTGAARREHLAQAAELCARLGAACDLDRVERLRQRA